MQSSTAIAIRALIMLVVLISVPLFAIFGKQLPDVVKGLMEGRGLVLGPAPGGDANSPAPAPTQTANNPFGQPASYRATPSGSNPTNSAATNSAPASMTATLTSPNATVPGPNANGQAAMPPGSNLTSMPPSGMSMNPAPPSRPAEMPAGSAAGAMGMPGDLSAMNRGPGALGQMPSGMGTKGDFVGSAPPLMQTSNPNQPANFLAPGDNGAMAKPPEAAIRDVTPTGNSPGAPASSPYGSAAGGAADGAGSAAGVGTDEKFRQAEMRLRELGATHYMLETWGPDNSRYRFVCKMAVGGNAEVNRYFQAIDDNPWQAMQSVLSQVEQWRARPQP